MCIPPLPSALPQVAGIAPPASYRSVTGTGHQAKLRVSAYILHHHYHHHHPRLLSRPCVESTTDFVDPKPTTPTRCPGRSLIILASLKRPARMLLQRRTQSDITFVSAFLDASRRSHYRFLCSRLCDLVG